jgi:hypothetical protein
MDTFRSAYNGKKRLSKLSHTTVVEAFVAAVPVKKAKITVDNRKGTMT